MIKFDFQTYSKNLISENKVNKFIKKLDKYDIYKEDMTGFMDFEYLKSDINEIKEVKEYINSNCEAFIVIGTGGSYLGAKSIVNLFKKNNKEIYFIGDSLSSEYFEEIKKIIKEKEVIVNVISKSGNTFEIKLYFDLIKKELEKKYLNYHDRIIITTTKDNELSKEPCYKVLYIKENIGGRFSVFTSAGLLPIAVADINIENLVLGASDSIKNFDNQKRYASIKKIMNKEKQVEAFVVYEPKLYYFTEWIKQLFAESLGKNKDGLLPISFINTRDLHSMEQYIQDGKQILFETVISIEKTNEVFVDEYNKTLDELNNIAQESVSYTHYNNKILNSIIKLDKLDEYNIGYLMQFFMVSCAFCGFLQKINAFNQEKVEIYKKNLKNTLKLRENY